MAAVFDQLYCLPGPATFSINDSYKHSGSWTGGDVKVLDGNGSLAFSVDANAWSCKQLKVMKDASGNTVCSLKQKVRTATCLPEPRSCILECIAVNPHMPFDPLLQSSSPVT